MSRPQTRPSAGLVVCGCQAVSPAVCRWGEWLCSTHFLQRASASQSVLHVLQASVMAPHRPIPCVQAAPQELGLHAMYSPPYTRTDIYTRSAPLSSQVITQSLSFLNSPLPPKVAALFCFQLQPTGLPLLPSHWSPGLSTKKAAALNSNVYPFL